MYSRTQNENGTYNTLCLDCCMTIAFCVESPKELDLLEGRHMCPEKALHFLHERELEREAHVGK